MPQTTPRPLPRLLPAFALAAAFAAPAAFAATPAPITGIKNVTISSSFDGNNCPLEPLHVV